MYTVFVIHIHLTEVYTDIWNIPKVCGCCEETVVSWFDVVLCIRHDAHKVTSDSYKDSPLDYAGMFHCHYHLFA